jgi:hypothetical protein
MTDATRKLSSRERSSMIYNLSLTGEVSTSGWAMCVDRARLLKAIATVAGAAPVAELCRSAPPGSKERSDRLVVLTVCEAGLSVRSVRSRADLPALGFWASPIAVDGARLRRVAASLPGPHVHFEYSKRWLTIDEKRIRAREL